MGRGNGEKTEGKKKRGRLLLALLALGGVSHALTNVKLSALSALAYITLWR